MTVDSYIERAHPYHGTPASHHSHTPTELIQLYDGTVKKRVRHMGASVFWSAESSEGNYSIPTLFFIVSHLG
ncbi:unnamed protein product [Danaus chrysippus]|uniref:(African queen) hypothetical protein n=1 Tax=Danaus chrysippus TaxID=151541 RepID=A0A8J2MW05_9NEOP|nr:unnamed protein product [Danaus chrysippus]